MRGWVMLPENPRASSMTVVPDTAVQGGTEHRARLVEERLRARDGLRRLSDGGVLSRARRMASSKVTRSVATGSTAAGSGIGEGVSVWAKAREDKASAAAVSTARRGA